MRRALCVWLFAGVLALVGCKRTYTLHTRTSPDLNAPAGLGGQPVLVGLYVLGSAPRDLETAACEVFRSPAATVDYLGGDLLHEEQPVSLVPGDTRGTEVRLTRRAGARWLMIVPYFEEKCAGDADRWALVRLSPVTRRRSVELSRSTILLPWERRPWRQRGCVSGRASHVRWRICG